MSLFDRIIARPRPLWVTIAISLLLFLAPVGATALDGNWNSFLGRGYWRPLLLSPIVIIYILIVSQAMAKSNASILNAFRPLVLINDDSFNALVQKESRINPLGEIIALFVGGLIGFGLSLAWLKGITSFWLKLYVPVSLCLMLGLLGWTIYASIASTKLIGALHRQPLQLDILNIKPFEPMGRHSLVSALVFVGGITLGVIFGLDTENILAWQTWLFFLPLMAIPVIIFFLNMRETHRLLATEKRRQLHAVAQKIYHASRVMQSRIARDETLADIAVEYSALVAYEARLRTTSTWPYNTAMLRMLFFTILMPLLVRGLSAILFGQ